MCHQETGENPIIFPNFQNCTRCEKDLKDNKGNSCHLGRKYARIFVLGHCLFLVAHSFPQASLSENCSLLGTDNVHGQISQHIFMPNGDYCLYKKIIYKHLFVHNQHICDTCMQPHYLYWFWNMTHQLMMYWLAIFIINNITVLTHCDLSVPSQLPLDHSHFPWQLSQLQQIDYQISKAFII